MIKRRTYSLALAITVIALWCVSAFSAAVTMADWKTAGELRDFAAASLGASATELSILPAGESLVAVSRHDAPLAYIASTWDIAHTAGYSGRPVKILVLVDVQAVIRGAWLIEQQEPVLTLGIDPARIDSFVRGFAGYDLKKSLQVAGQSPAGLPDAIAGATISSGVIRSGIIRTARMIAETRGLLSAETSAIIATGMQQPLSWPELLAKGAVSRLDVKGADANAALGTASGAAATDNYIELYAALLDVPAIGVSLLGEA